MKTTRVLAALAITAVALTTAVAEGKKDTKAPASASKTFEVSWTYGYWGTETDPKNLFAQKVMEKFPNLKLTMEYVPQKTLNQKYAVLVAAGNQPDVLCSQGTGSWIDWVRQGAYLDLTPYWNDYPNIKANISPEVLSRSTKIDGKIYGIPILSKDITRVMGYRADWLKKVGKSVPKTIEELYDVMVAFTKNDPDGNGKNDTYGLGFSKEMSEANMLFGPTFKFELGGKADIALYRKSNGSIELGFMQPGMKDYLAFLRKAWAEGLIDPSSITLNAVDALFTNGTIGIYPAQPTALMSYYEAANLVNPKAEFVLGEPVVAKNYGTPAYVKGSGWFRMHQITNSVKDPDEVRAILSMFDWLFGDGYDLLRAGVPGVHYTKDANGILTKTDAYTTDTWNNFVSLLKRKGARYFLDAYEEQDPMGKLGMDMIAKYEKYAVEPVILANKPPAAEYGADLQRITMEGMFKIIIGEKPLEHLNELQAEYMKRGGKEYLEQALEVIKKQEN